MSIINTGTDVEEDEACFRGLHLRNVLEYANQLNYYLSSWLIYLSIITAKTTSLFIAAEAQDNMAGFHSHLYFVKVLIPKAYVVGIFDGRSSGESY